MLSLFLAMSFGIYCILHVYLGVQLLFYIYDICLQTYLENRIIIYKKWKYKNKDSSENPIVSLFFIFLLFYNDETLELYPCIRTYKI